jgi:trans-aconitate methyltransferase
MFTNDSDKAWGYFGKKNPYFGVLTAQEFRGGNLTREAKEHFFETGQRYVEFLLSTIHEHVDPAFKPTRGLDFGCGVGRLTIPLAKRCESMIGVDVSDGMLAEAARNSEEYGASNVTFARSDDRLSKVAGPLDLVHSFIVFQHIPPRRGEVILKTLIGLLAEGGVGALHFTFSWSSGTSPARRLLTRGYKDIPFAFGIRNLLKGKPVNEPMMQMNEYNLNRLFRILQESDCHNVHVRFTETGHYGQPFYGAILFFQKKRLDVRAHG